MYIYNTAVQRTGSCRSGRNGPRVNSRYMCTNIRCTLYVHGSSAETVGVRPLSARLRTDAANKTAAPLPISTADVYSGTAIQRTGSCRNGIIGTSHNFSVYLNVSKVTSYQYDTAVAAAPLKRWGYCHPQKRFQKLQQYGKQLVHHPLVQHTFGVVTAVRSIDNITLLYGANEVPLWVQQCVTWHDTTPPLPQVQRCSENVVGDIEKPHVPRRYSIQYATLYVLLYTIALGHVCGPAIPAPTASRHPTRFAETLGGRTTAVRHSMKNKHNHYIFRREDIYMYSSTFEHQRLQAHRTSASMFQRHRRRLTV